MADQASPQIAATTKQVTELTLLYQFSNTMLSTIRLNKLTHLILTRAYLRHINALRSGSSFSHQ